LKAARWSFLSLVTCLWLGAQTDHFTAFTNDGPFRLGLRASAVAGKRFTLFDGASLIGTSVADGAGTISFTASHLSPGLHMVRAVEWGTGKTIAMTSVTIPTLPLRGLSVAEVFPTEVEPLVMAAGNISNDGLVDIVVAGNDRLAILHNDGKGKFLSPVIFKGVANPVGLALADFDGDGHTDIAAIGSDGHLEFWRNGQISELILAGHASALTVADFNSDGIPDLAIADPVNNTLTILLGKGDFTFTAIPFTLGMSPGAIVAADFNGDGFADLAAADLNSNAVSVLLGDGKGGFRLAGSYGAGNRPTSLTASDINQDGTADLVVADRVNNTASVLMGSGDGRFVAAQTIRDVLAASAGSGLLASARRNGKLNIGGYLARVGPAALALLVTDIDGDGVPDVLEADASGAVYAVLGMGASPAGDLTAPPASAAATMPRGKRKPSLAVGPEVVTSSISGILPNAAASGGSAVELFVLGSGFSLSGVNVYWNSNPLQDVNVTDSCCLTAEVPAAFLASPGTAYIYVENPGETGSNIVPFAVSATVPIPSLTQINTSSINNTMYVSGTGFASGMTLSCDGVFVGTYNLYYGVSLPADLIQTAGPVEVTATNPGGTPSAPVILNVPAPVTLTSLSPSEVAPGSDSTVLTVNGSGFASGDSISVNYQTLPTTFINSSQLQATVPSALFGLSVEGQNYWMPVSVNSSNSNSSFTSINQLFLTVGATGEMIMTISSTHVGNFAAGQRNATYTLTATDASGAANYWKTTVTEELPSSLTLVSMTGTGWACTGASCTLSTPPLPPWASYPPITVTVNVSSVIPPILVNQAKVSYFPDMNAGTAVISSASDPTIVADALAVNSLTVGPAMGTGSVDLLGGFAWTAASGAAWLHLAAGSTSGTGGQTVIFSYDANPGATRFGTITFSEGAFTLTVTQAGSGYVAANQVNTLVSSGLISPYGAAVDASGNVYTADYFFMAVKEWNASTMQLNTLVSSGLSYPEGVTVDASGNVYIADTNHNAVKKWTASTGQVTTLPLSGLNSPQGVAVDTSGNVYIADSLNNSVKEWTVSNQQTTTLVSSGLTSPAGVAVDNFGNVYIADTINNTLKVWSSATQQVTQLVSSGLSEPSAVTVGPTGNVYIADTGNSAIKEWNIATQQTTTLVSSGLHFPYGVAVDASGNVYIADTGNGQIKMSPAAWVNTSAISVPPLAGNSALQAVLPTSAPIGLFAPTSDQTWLSIGAVANGIVSFSYTANTTGSSRMGHLTVLGQSITVMQTVDKCDINQDGSTNISDAQAMVTQASGATKAVNFLDGSNVITVVDAQIVINAALGLGCAAQ
jgi:sugar lactone lactonase YvrE